MKIGNVLFTFFRQEDKQRIAEKLPEVLRTLYEIGYAGVEGVPRSFVPLLSELNLKPITVVESFAPFPEDEEIPEIAEYACSFGVKTIVIGPSKKHAREAWVNGYTEKTLRDEVERTTRMGKICRDYDIDLCLHIEGKAVLTTGRLLELTEPEYVNLCLDTGWMMAGLRDPIELVAKNVKRIKHVHLKDWKATPFNVGLGAPLLGEFCELGTGEVKHPEILDILKKARYDGWYVVEIPVFHNRDVARAPSPEESAEINLEYLRRLSKEKIRR